MSDPAVPDKPATLRAALQIRPPVSELIGFEVAEASEGHVVVVLQAGTQHFNPMGTVHGESFTTVELKINFLRPVRQTLLRAAGRVVQRGRTIGYVECEITDENGKLVAKSNSTCLVLRGDQAAGR